MDGNMEPIIIYASRLSLQQFLIVLTSLGIVAISGLLILALEDRLLLARG